MVVTYGQFLGSRFDERGASWGSSKGVRFRIETEGHFPLNEICQRTGLDSGPSVLGRGGDWAT